MSDELRDQINDIIEGEIQNGINDYIEQQGRGFDGKLNVKVDQDEVDKLIKQYKKIKKASKSNLGQVRKLGLLDKYGKPLK
jgi:methionyl-tRNA synthetase